MHFALPTGIHHFNFQTCKRCTICYMFMLAVNVVDDFLMFVCSFVII